jgi:hypothetical protein
MKNFFYWLQPTKLGRTRKKKKHNIPIAYHDYYGGSLCLKLYFIIYYWEARPGDTHTHKALSIPYLHASSSLLLLLLLLLL